MPTTDRAVSAGADPTEGLAEAYHRYRTQYPGGTIFCGDEHGPFEFDSAVCNCRMDMEGTLRLSPVREEGEPRP